MNNNTLKFIFGSLYQEQTKEFWDEFKNRKLNEIRTFFGVILFFTIIYELGFWLPSAIYMKGELAPKFFNTEYKTELITNSVITNIKPSEIVTLNVPIFKKSIRTLSSVDNMNNTVVRKATDYIQSGEMRNPEVAVEQAVFELLECPAGVSGKSFANMNAAYWKRVDITIEGQVQVDVNTSLVTNKIFRIVKFNDADVFFLDTPAELIAENPHINMQEALQNHSWLFMHFILLLIYIVTGALISLIVFWLRENYVEMLKERQPKEQPVKEEPTTEEIKTNQSLGPK